MRASTGVFPRLGRYFETMNDLADAGNISPRRTFDCVRGIKQFTDQEKRAIVNAIIAHMVVTGKKKDELQDMVEALDDFDKVFRRSDNA